MQLIFALLAHAQAAWGLAAPVRNTPFGMPIIWKPPAAQPSRVTIRSRFTEFCVRGWAREQVARQRLVFGNATVDVGSPARCGFDGSSGDSSRSCADVVKWTGDEVEWWGYEQGLKPKLKLRKFEAELTNLHKRVLTRGRRGSVRATLVATGGDVDGSVWIRGFLERIVARVLREVEGYETPPSFDFVTKVDRGPEDPLTRERAPVVRLKGRTADGVGFTIAFALAAENGALTFRKPEIYLAGRGAFRLRRMAKGVPVPAAVLEDLGSLYLSTLAVDASAPSGAAFAITDVEPDPDRPDAVRVGLVSSAASRAAMQRIARRTAAGSPASLPDKNGPEWRIHLKSLIEGAAHPLRQTFVVGERLPWILNPKSKPPPAVTTVFRVLSLMFSLAAVPDTVLRAGVVLFKKLRISVLRPRLAKAYRNDGLAVGSGRRFEPRSAAI